MTDKSTLWMQRTDVARRYGVTPRTIVRWELDPSMKFPQSRKIRNRNYTNADELAAYDAREAVR